MIPDNTLCTYRDPLDYPPLALWELNDALEDGIWLEQPSAIAEHRRPPEFHDRIDSSVFPDTSGRVPIGIVQNFILARSDVTLAGYRCYVGNDGSFNLDESVPEPSRRQLLEKLCLEDQLSSEAVGFENASDTSVRFRMQDRQVFHLDGVTISLASLEPSNYGSFLFRVLPKISAAFRFSRDLKILLPIYHENFRSYLHVLGFSDAQIIPHYANSVYVLSRALIPSLRNPECWFDRSSIAFYDELRYRYGVGRVPGRKVFLTRVGVGAMPQGSGGRVMLNEPELRSALTSRGYEVVEPSRLRPLQQIGEFSSAEIIVTASGSAMFNAVFCHAGTKILDIESEPHWIHAHMCLFGSRELRYGIFEGEVTVPRVGHHLPFKVDVARLIDRLDAFEKA
jgi:hypothetical protein